MEKQKQQFELVEDVTIEELLREELEDDNSSESEETKKVKKEGQESDEDEESHPKAGEPDGDEVCEKKGESEEDESEEKEEVSEKKGESEEEDESEEDEDEVSENKKHDEHEASESEDEEAAEHKEESYDFSEDVKALEAAGEGLTEDYKSKAKTIFEAAVTEKIASEKKKLEESYKDKLYKSTNKIADTITEKVDSYLNYVVSTWMEENKVAVETGLRTELTETFITSLKKVFVENYVEVPDSKRDLYSELEEKVSQLQESVKASEETLSETKKELEQFQRKAIIAEACEGLADTQAERLTSLTSDIEFFSEEAFAAKVKTIKESYFKSSRRSIQTGVSTSVLSEHSNNNQSSGTRIDPEMKAYSDAISRIARKAKQV